MHGLAAIRTDGVLAQIFTFGALTLRFRPYLRLPTWLLAVSGRYWRGDATLMVACRLAAIFGGFSNGDEGVSPSMMVPLSFIPASQDNPVV